MRLRSYHTALFGIVFFFIAWDLWAVLSDLRITISPDSSSPGTIQLRHIFWEDWCAIRLQHWLYTHKGPALHLLALPLLLLIEQAPLSSRILGVLLHGVVLWQVFYLCRRLGGDRRAALLSTIILGVSPMVFGWFRLDFYEGLHSVIACAVLQMMIKVRLDRPGPAAALGLLIGLGVLTKNSFYLIMVAPALWFLWCRCRHLRSWPSLLALVATTALLVVPWVVFKFSELVDNFLGSAGSNAFTWDKFLESSSLYLSLPGVALLLLCACLSAVALWRRGARQVLVLVLGTLVVYVIFIFAMVDAWSRYILPISPLAAALSGCGLSLALQRIPTALRRPAATAFIALLVGAFIFLNTVSLQPPRERENRRGWGMTRPDTRQYWGFYRAATTLVGEGSEMLVTFDSIKTLEAVERLFTTYEIWKYRGVDLRKISYFDSVREQWGHSTHIPLLLVRDTQRKVSLEQAIEDWVEYQRGIKGVSYANIEGMLRLLRDQSRRLLSGFTDPDGLRYEVFRVKVR